MKKFIPCVFAAAGCAGALLRRAVKNGIDAETGFLPDGFVPNIVLAVLCAAAVIGAIAIAMTVPKKCDAECGDVFKMSTLEFIVWFAGAAVVGGQGVAKLMHMTGAVDAAFAIAAIITAVAQMTFAMSLKNGKKMNGLAALFAVAPLFYVFWLALLYREFSENPRIYLFCYEVLALSAAALVNYAVEGYLCRRAAPRLALAAGLAGTFFGFVSICGFTDFADIAAMASIIEISVITSLKVLRSAK